MKNPDIKGKEYQQGERYQIDGNLRAYILFRDSHECQNPNCRNKTKDGKKKDNNIELQVHHIIYRSNNGSDSPNNLITLCCKCHTLKDHESNGYLSMWKPKINSYREATFMNIVKPRIIDIFGNNYTYGYITKENRLKLGIEKTHYNDAFVAGGGTNQIRCKPIEIIEIRRNNRSLSRFRDAHYIDIRDGKEKTGKELSSGRRKRNKNLNDENLRKYRGKKIIYGLKIDKDKTQNVQAKRYHFQNGDEVIYNGKKYLCGGMQSKGSQVILKIDKEKKVVNAKLVKPYRYGKGFVFL
jgi:hypothetical protein